MVTINYCPSCGCELNKGSFVCPKCGLDFKDIVENRHLLKSNDADNTVDFVEDDEILSMGNAPIFEIAEGDENNIEIVLDDEDLFGPDGMPREIPIEIFVEGEDDGIEFEIVSDDDDSNIVIESDDNGNFVIKPKIEFPCPVCGAPVGEDLVCKSCYAEFSIAPDFDEEDK